MPSSRKLSISVIYIALNLPGIFFKMSKFKTFITQVTKIKFEEKTP